MTNTHFLVIEKWRWFYWSGHQNFHQSLQFLSYYLNFWNLSILYFGFPIIYSVLYFISQQLQYWTLSHYFKNFCIVNISLGKNFLSRHSFRIKLFLTWTLSSTHDLLCHHFMESAFQTVFIYMYGMWVRQLIVRSTSLWNSPIWIFKPGAIVRLSLWYFKIQFQTFVLHLYLYIVREGRDIAYRVDFFCMCCYHRR